MIWLESIKHEEPKVSVLQANAMPIFIKGVIIFLRKPTTLICQLSKTCQKFDRFALKIKIIVKMSNYSIS